MSRFFLSQCPQANYANFSVTPDPTHTLHVDGFSSPSQWMMGDDLVTWGGSAAHPFSTFDMDQDGHSTLNCAQNYTSAGWYRQQFIY